LIVIMSGSEVNEVGIQDRTDASSVSKAGDTVSGSNITIEQALQVIAQARDKVDKPPRKKKRNRSNRSDNLTIDEDFAEIDDDFSNMQKQIDEILGMVRKTVTKMEIANIVKNEVSNAVKSEIANIVKKEITGAVKNALKEAKEEIEGLKHEIAVLRDEKEILRTALIKVEKNQKSNQTSSEAKMDISLRAANANEQYSRKNNIKITGLPLQPNEDCEQYVCDTINRYLQLGLSKNDIDVAHRLPSKFGRVPVIIVRFKFREMRGIILTRKKEIPINSGIKVKEDLTQANTGLMNRAFDHPGVEFVYCLNGKIFMVTKEWYRIRIDIFENLTEKIQNQADIGKKLTPRIDEGRPARTPRTGPLFCDFKAYGL